MGKNIVEDWSKAESALDRTVSLGASAIVILLIGVACVIITILTGGG